MRKMKILTLLLCASLAFAYMGCSNSSGGSDNSSSSNTSSSGSGSGADTGSGAGSGSTPITYTITIANGITNGTVTANPASAIAGSTVTLSIISEIGYKLNSISATTGETAVTLSGTGNTRTFTMPAGNVSVNAVFISVFTALAAGTNGTAGTSGTYVYFGEWPQTQLTGSVTVDDSNSKIVGMFIYYKGSDNAWYAKVSSNYFKVEPIKWRVLNPAATGSEKKMLLAENILINCAYYDFYNVNRTIGNASVYPNNYEHSRVRAFLNGLGYQKKESDSAVQEENNEFRGKGFLQTAFTAEEIAAIADTGVVNNARSTNPDGDSNANLWNNGDNTYASATPTEDKLFLLSEQEVTKSSYDFSSSYSSGTLYTNIRVPTDYAKANYVDLGSVSSQNRGNWWLRSPFYDNSGYVHHVRNTGDVFSTSILVNLESIGVVPALCLN